MQQNNKNISSSRLTDYCNTTNDFISSAIQCNCCVY